DRRCVVIDLAQKERRVERQADAEEIEADQADDAAGAQEELAQRRAGEERRPGLADVTDGSRRLAFWRVLRGEGPCSHRNIDVTGRAAHSCPRRPRRTAPRAPPPRPRR